MYNSPMKATRKLLATYRAVILGVHAVYHQGAFKLCERCKEYRDIAANAKNEMGALVELVAEKYAAVPIPAQEMDGQRPVKLTAEQVLRTAPSSH